MEQMTKQQLITLVLFLAVASVSAAAQTDNKPTSSPQNTSAEGWEFSVTPYAFFSGLKADIFRNLDFALMGTFEARKGNWLILTDAMYMSLSGKRVTPSPFFSDIDVKVKETIIDPEVGYRVVRRERGSIDLLAGVRIWHVKPHLTFQPRILPLVDVEESKNWADPVVGVRGMASLSPRVFVTGRFDVGGFGVGSDFTGQAFGGAGFQLKPKIALVGGYRYLRADYVNEGFIFKTSMNGIVLGAKFKF
jgi:hypothetical protein